MVPTSPLSSEAARSPSRTWQTTPDSSKSEIGAKKDTGVFEVAAGEEQENSRSSAKSSSSFESRPSRRESVLDNLSIQAFMVVEIRLWTSWRIASEPCSRRPAISAREALLLFSFMSLFFISQPERTTLSKAAKRSANSTTQGGTGGRAATTSSIFPTLISKPRLTSAAFSRKASMNEASHIAGGGSSADTMPKHLLQSGIKRSH
mmetsp:Transcript_16522/g.45729  ORF Transcript_16522/g.45729 Transcript_16522/m.45729 type:complete len:205 (+) Transcript_16522:338-952(+)